MFKTQTIEDSSATPEALDQEEAQLRAEAEAISPARPEDSAIPEVPSEAEERASAHAKPDAKTKARPDSAKSSAATDAAQSAKTSKATAPATPKPADPKTAQQTPTTDTTVDESKMTPFQKERHRLNQTWKQVQADKAAIQKDRETLETERRAWQEQQQKAQSQKPAKADGPTAEDYDAVAADLEAEGKINAAKRAKAKAAELREQSTTTRTQASNGPRERFTPEEQKTMATEWQTNLEKAGQENPDLTQEGTPLRARVSELLRTTPEFHSSGRGILMAVEFAKTELKAKQAEVMQAKVTELEAKLKELTELTALPSGHATPAARAQRFDEMTLDQQEAALREDATAT